MANGRRILIVTPAYEAERYIEETIMSVATQAGSPLAVHYHVQDGGSRDGTVELVAKVFDRLATAGQGETGMTFSLASAADAGMYDAINKAFDILSPADGDILTWINSDDLLAPGALRTVFDIMSSVPDCEFVSGRVALLNEHGSVTRISPLNPYNSEAIAAGLHDGRHRNFIMQEGTFFTGRAWSAVRGVDDRFRLAGDWDLWRRMAATFTHFAADTLTGFHRRRAGQLSQDMARYYDEVDRVLDHRPSGGTSLPETGNVVQFEADRQAWVAKSFGVDAAPSVAHAIGAQARGAPCQAGTGFGPLEGPYPEYKLPGMVRWLEGRRGTILASAPLAGQYGIRLTIRPAVPGIVVSLSISGRPALPFRLANPETNLDQIIDVETWLEEGPNDLVVAISQPDATRMLLLIDMTAIPIPPQYPGANRLILMDARQKEDELCVLVTGNDDNPDGLDRTLRSCLALTGFRCRVFLGMAARAGLEAIVADRWTGLMAGHVLAPLPSGGDYKDILHSLAGQDGLVLCVRKGDALLEDGVRLALAALAPLRTGAIFGAVDLCLADLRPQSTLTGTVDGPVLYRLDPDSASLPIARRLNAAITRRLSYAPPVGPRGALTVIDPLPVPGRTSRALQVAKAAALLGFKTSYSIDANDGRARYWVGDGSTHRDLFATDIEPETLPPTVDTGLFRPRNLAAVRRGLQMSPSDFVLAIGDLSQDAMRLLLSCSARMGTTHRYVVNFGRTLIGHGPEPVIVLEMGLFANTPPAAWLLSACDLVVAADVDCEVRLASYAAGVPFVSEQDLLGISGEVDGHGGLQRLIAAAQERAMQRRALVTMRHSLAALAGAIWQKAGNADAPADDRLRSGDVVVERGSLPFDATERFQGQQAGAWLPILGCSVASATTQAGRLLVERPVARCSLFFDRGTGNELRLHLSGTPADIWTIGVGDRLIDIQLEDDGRLTAVWPATLHAGFNAVSFLSRNGARDATAQCVVENWELIDTRRRDDEADHHTIVSLAPPGRGSVAHLTREGDWIRVDGFREIEPPFPRAGFYAPFQWSAGHHFKLMVRGSERDTLLSIVCSAGVRGQRVRPVIDGVPLPWSQPLTGPIGHAERLSWLVELSGDRVVDFEVDRVMPTDDRPLGLVLLAVDILPG